MSSFGTPVMSANHRLRIAGMPVRRGRGIIGNSLHYLGRLANGEDAYRHLGLGGNGWLYVPKKDVADAISGSFGGHGLKKRKTKRRGRKGGKGFKFRIL